MAVVAVVGPTISCGHASGNRRLVASGTWLVNSPGGSFRIFVGLAACLVSRLGVVPPSAVIGGGGYSELSLFCCIFAQDMLGGAEPLCRLCCASRSLPALLDLLGAAAFSAVRYLGRGRGWRSELVTAMGGCCQGGVFSRTPYLLGALRAMALLTVPGQGCTGSEKRARGRRGLRCFPVRRGLQTPRERGLIARDSATKPAAVFVAGWRSRVAARGVAREVEV